MGKRASLGADWGGVSGFVGKKMGRGRSKSPKKAVADESNPATASSGPDPVGLYLTVPGGPTPPPKDYEAKQPPARVDSTHRSSADGPDTHQRANSQVRWASSLRNSEDSTRIQVGRTSVEQLSLQHQSRHHYGFARPQSQPEGVRLGAESTSPDEISGFNHDENEDKTNNVLANNTPGNQIWPGAAIIDDSFTPPFPSGEKSIDGPQVTDDHYDDELSFYDGNDYMSGGQAGLPDPPLADTRYLGDGSGPLDSRPSIANMAESSQLRVPMPDPTKDHDNYVPELSTAVRGSFSWDNPRSGLTPAPLKIPHKRVGSCPGTQPARFSPQAAEFHGFPTPNQSSDSQPTGSSVQPSFFERRALADARTTGATGIGGANTLLATNIERFTARAGNAALRSVQMAHGETGAQTTSTDMDNLDHLEYPPHELRDMPFDALRKAAFDPEPHQTPQTPSTATIPLDSLSTRLASKLHASPEEQAEFFASLTLKQWEEAGDWFIQRFGDQMKQMVALRKEKRQREEELEKDVARRNDEIARKKMQIDEAIVRMRTDGGKILRKG